MKLIAARIRTSCFSNGQDLLLGYSGSRSVDSPRISLHGRSTSSTGIDRTTSDWDGDQGGRADRTGSTAHGTFQDTYELEFVDQRRLTEEEEPRSICSSKRRGSSCIRSSRVRTARADPDPCLRT